MVGQKSLSCCNKQKYWKITKNISVQFVLFIYLQVTYWNFIFKICLIFQEQGYLSFNGSVSRSNRGGFASFRILPLIKEELKKVLSGTKSIVLEVKNLENKNNRYKFQMANEAHLKSFNWQAEFVVEPDNDFHTVVLDIYSFWPTMFGHVLSSPGNVDFSKVDCLGMLISHVTVDGKENPDFVEGDYGLAIRSVRFIKEDDEDWKIRKAVI